MLKGNIQARGGRTKWGRVRRRDRKGRACKKVH